MSEKSVPFHLAVLAQVAPKFARKRLSRRKSAADQHRAARRLRHMHSPVIKVPPLARGIDACVAPDDAAQMRQMVKRLHTIHRAGAQVIWQQSNILTNPPHPNAFLGQHPDISLSKAFRQILFSAFPDALSHDLERFLWTPATTNTLRPSLQTDRVRYLHTLLSFLDCPVEDATAIEAHIAITPDMRALRLQVQRAQAAHRIKMQANAPLNPIENLIDAGNLIAH